MLPKDLAKGGSWEPWKIFPKIMVSEFFSEVQGLLGGTNGDHGDMVPTSIAVFPRA